MSLPPSNLPRADFITAVDHVIRERRTLKVMRDPSGCQELPADVAADLYAAVQAVGIELCPALGITIPVGKDSMSMSTVWKDGAAEKRMTAPVSLIVSAFAPVSDIRLTLTPQLSRSGGVPPPGSSDSEARRDASPTTDDTVLLLVDLGRGKNRLGGSILAQVVSQMGEATPDVDHPADLKNFWNAIQKLGQGKKLLAYHDRSDGGLLATVAEMAFAGHVGVDLTLPNGHEAFSALFSEELGAVIQVRLDDLDDVSLTLREHGLKDCTTRIGTLNRTHTLRVSRGGKVLFAEDLFALRDIWSDVTRRIASLRDNPACAEQEHALRIDPKDPGITPLITFKLTTGNTGGTEAQSGAVKARSSSPSASAPSVVKNPKPPVAILREQGVNGEVEMAVRELGASRVLYGSDVNGRSFSSQIGRVLGAEISLADKKLILRENLRRLLAPALKRKGITA